MHCIYYTHLAPRRERGPRGRRGSIQTYYYTLPYLVTIVCYALLYNNKLHYIILYSTLLYSALLCSTPLFHANLLYSTLLSTQLYYIHCIYYTILTLRRGGSERRVGGVEVLRSELRVEHHQWRRRGGDSTSSASSYFSSASSSSARAPRVAGLAGEDVVDAERANAGRGMF